MKMSEWAFASGGFVAGAAATVTTLVATIAAMFAFGWPGGPPSDPPPAPYARLHEWARDVSTVELRSEVVALRLGLAPGQRFEVEALDLMYTTPPVRLRMGGLLISVSDLRGARCHAEGQAMRAGTFEVAALAEDVERVLSFTSLGGRVAVVRTDEETYYLLPEGNCR